MSDPTSLPFQDDDRPGAAPEDSIYQGRRPEAQAPDGEVPTGESSAGDGLPVAAGAGDVADAGGGGTAPTSAVVPEPESETDLLAAKVTGPDDHVGMTALWRLTMSLEHWWFIAVGEDGMESPAAATIDDQLMLLTFTTAQRARDFAVENGMIAADEDLRAIALPPREVVESAETYREAGIGGLMFDPHVAGYFIPTGQLPVVWDAVHSTADDVDPVQGAEDSAPTQD